MNRTSLAGLLLLVVGVLVLPPMFVLVQQSVMPDSPARGGGGLTFGHYIDLFASSRLYSSAWNSIVFSTFATAVSVIFGAAVAWIVERTDAPLKILAYATAVVSLGTPYILYVTAWLFLLGRAGPFNGLLQYLLHTSSVPVNVYSIPGMVLVEGLLWSPLVFLLLSATFRAANAEMEEAARMSGASVSQTVWMISMKLARPAVLAMIIFVFIRNLESFEVPILIGEPGRVNLLTSDVYDSVRHMPIRLGYASAFAIVMLVLVAILLYFYGRISRHAERYASITGKGYRPRPFILGRIGRVVCAGMLLFNFSIVLVLPVCALIWTALMPFVRPMNLDSLHLVTMQNFVAVWDTPGYFQLGWRTILVAAVTSTVVMAITVASGWWSARRQPAGGWIDQLVTSPLIFPGIVLGVAMMEIGLRTPFPLYGTIWLIALAYTIRYLPYGMRYTYAGTLQIHRELEEAAVASGANLWEVMTRIVLPLLSPAVFAGWVFIFLIASKELAMAVLLAGPHSKVMAVVMFDLWTNGQSGELSALGLIWLVLISASAGLLYVVSRRRAVGAFG